MPSQGHTGAAAVCMEECRLVAPVMAATPRHPGPKRHVEDDLWLPRVRLARMASRPRLRSRDGRQGRQRFAVDRKQSPVVGDLEGDRQVRLRVCQLPPHTHNRTPRERLRIMTAEVVMSARVRARASTRPGPHMGWSHPSVDEWDQPVFRCVSVRADLARGLPELDREGGRDASELGFHYHL
jgi:hypothetical protein